MYCSSGVLKIWCLFLGGGYCTMLLRTRVQRNLHRGSIVGSVWPRISMPYIKNVIGMGLAFWGLKFERGTEEQRNRVIPFKRGEVQQAGKV